MADLRTDVRYIKGIGEQRAKALAKLNIRTLRDLIAYFPRKYDDRTQIKRVEELQPGETACVAAMVAAEPKVSHIRRGLDLVKLRAVDESEEVLFSLGFSDFRVRLRDGGALLQITAKQQEKARQLFPQIRAALTKNFHIVRLDPKAREESQ